MSGYIVTDFQLSISDGKLEDFKSIVNTMVEITELNEPSTLVYEYHINEDGTECHLLETFKDSDAFMAHLANVGHLFDTLFESVIMARAKIFGSPSTELKQALEPLGVEYFSYLNGIERPSEKKTYTEQAREYARVRES